MASTQVLQLADGSGVVSIDTSPLSVSELRPRAALRRLSKTVRRFVTLYDNELTPAGERAIAAYFKRELAATQQAGLSAPSKTVVVRQKETNGLAQLKEILGK